MTTITKTYELGPGAKLRHADLHKLDLQDIDLSGADLRRANFHESNISNGNLRRANLNGADFERAHLQGTEFHYAKMNYVVLHHADMTGAYLVATDLLESDLFSANLTKALLPRANLQGANLGLANFEGAELLGANLRGAICYDTSFKNAELSNADLTGALLLGTDLTGSTLNETNLCEADLEGAIIDDGERKLYEIMGKKMTTQYRLEIIEGTASELETIVSARVNSLIESDLSYSGPVYLPGPDGLYAAFIEYEEPKEVPGALRVGMSLQETREESIARVEKTLIEKALEQTGGNLTQAGRVLQIGRKSLRIKMKELGISSTEYTKK
ncbi:MAG: hypothetical protein CMH61_02595 [Nanoarchaeota archaeon]|nr:hypothetical protein [Nanoarchaeota archaeon]